MTPKQKAEELINLYNPLMMELGSFFSGEKCNLFAKRCATICVDQLMDNAEETLKDFWADVFAEIELL